MVLASEVNPVNRLYRELSSRYRAGWTFHRFIRGLHKFFGGQDADDRTGDFQQLYQNLKELSTRLDDIDIAPIVERLEEAGRTLDDLIAFLDAQDRKIAPSLVRLFFHKVRAQDERILIDLVRFHLEAQRGRAWESERSDKVDYLLSRLGEMVTRSEGGGDPGRLKRVLHGISEYAGCPAVDPQKLSNRIKLIQAVRGEVERVQTFEALTEQDLVAHYRNVKHGLGALMFEESILPMIVSTNLVVASRVSELTDAAQERIFVDYEKVSELEERGLLSQGLAESVASLHQQVGTFRAQLQKGSLRLDAIAKIREAVQEVVEHLEVDRTDDPRAAPKVEEPDTLDVASVLATATERELLGQQVRDLIAALRETRRSSEQLSALDSRLLSYRLGAREVEAFARLSDGGPCDVPLEQFLLAAASLRHKIRLLAEDLQTGGPEMAAGGRREALAVCASALELGDRFVRRFDHLLEMRLFAAESPPVRQVQVSKMHLLREYSKLWLLVHDSMRDREA